MIGGDTTSLNARGKAKTEESKDVKSRTHRTNMIISLDCLEGIREREETLAAKRRVSPEQEGLARAIILASRVNVRLYQANCGDPADLM